MEETERLRRAIAAIDAANADDPNMVVVGGVSRPKELVHAELVTAWVHRLAAEPAEALLIAARAHHLRRWTIPRSSFPEGRAGYLRWRTTLHDQHAREVAVILTDVGYDAETVARVQQIVRKRGLGRDPEVQVFEDALCLVFLETQLRDIEARLEPEKLAGVIDKTKAKMSDRALDLALGLDLGPAERALLTRSPEPSP